MKKSIQVREKGTGKIIETIRRVIRSESIGNFNPLFCTYNKNNRNLAKSDEGDISDPFRRDETYLETLFIEVWTAENNERETGREIAPFFVLRKGWKKILK